MNTAQLYMESREKRPEMGGVPVGPEIQRSAYQRINAIETVTKNLRVHVVQIPVEATPLPATNPLQAQQDMDVSKGAAQWQAGFVNDHRQSYTLDELLARAENN